MRGDRGLGQRATGISLPNDLLRDAKIRAGALDLNMSQYIRRLISDDLQTCRPLRWDTGESSSHSPNTFPMRQAADKPSSPSYGTPGRRK
jgi:hypothetical protein